MNTNLVLIRFMITSLLIILIITWLGALTYLLFKTLTNYNTLTKGATDKTLAEVIKEFLKQNQITQSELNKTLAEIGKIRHEQLKFIRKLGVVRFNPFSDTGGDQSFTLAILDGEDNGLVITSLYARTGVRWYIKTIRKGKGLEHELSKEEKEAVSKALKAVSNTSINK
jgi:dolichyl-phosphate-mannose--protein O-mannosyl transferase